MHNWNKSDKLLGVCYDIRGVVLEEAERLERQGTKILKLNIGNTKPFGLLASDLIFENISLNLKESQGYEYSKGILPAREAISNYYSKKNIKLDVEDIYIGNGVSELISMCLRSLINNNDEILIPSPDYPLWTASTRLSGGFAIHYRCDEDNNWNPDINDIKNKITTNTKAIVVINPNNPTGAVYSKEILQEIVMLAQKHNLIIFADEIYERVIYDNHEMHYLAQLAGDHPCIFFNGLSKAYRAPGLRAGWFGIHDPNKQLKNYREGINMLSNMRLCGNIPSQWGIITALNHDNEIDNLVAPNGRLFEQRKIVIDMLKNIEGISTVTPKGAMYVFPKLDKKKFNLHSDERFVLDLLINKKILLVHGSAFNYPDCDHVRIVFLPKKDELSWAMTEIKDFLHTYTQ